ncbi:MAG: trypsin-like peptidase domain-containing protein [Verrucomicrobiaceae bacterium]|nr:trypsin-like peptidase domain-containing protein [Verrucomicrobiaceae bacterium]
MKTLTLIVLAFTSGFLFADGFKAPINDLQIKSTFEKQLGNLRDGGKLVAAEKLASQLKEQNQSHLKFPLIMKTRPVSTSIYEQNKKGILCFGNIYKCDRCDKWHSNIAGGFVISKEGLAVTNYHVMESNNAGAFGGMTIDGKLYPVTAVVASSKKNDLAIVQLQGENFHPLAISEGGAVGADVTVISHPEGRFFSVSRGIIARYYKERSGDHRGSSRMAITADYAKGSSGSPVFNQNGDVVGVVSTTRSIYYNKKEGIERNLQMVIKSCIPSGSILQLLKSGKKEN